MGRYMPERQHADEIWLVKRAQKGDSTAFGELYEFYSPRVFRFLYAHLDDRLDAEDLTEEIFLRVWEALPGFRLRGIPFGGYVFRVARNALYDHYRSTGRRRRPEDLEQERVDPAQPDPAETVPLTMQHRELRRTMVQLPEDYRMVVALRFLVGLSTDETAAALGRTIGATRVLQHRALLNLRQILDHQNYYDE